MYKDITKRKEHARKWRLDHPNYNRDWCRKNSRNRNEYQLLYRRSKGIKERVFAVSDPAVRMLKKKARAVVFVNIRNGKLKRLPCVVCGNLKSEAHHPDHSKPLDVVWLCKKHHKE